MRPQGNFVRDLMLGKKSIRKGLLEAETEIQQNLDQRKR